MANFIWSICNLLRGPYKRNEYRKVILPLTVLRRFDCVLEPTKNKVLEAYKKVKGKSENVVSAHLRTITGVPFYNVSLLNFRKLLDDPDQIALNLNSYIKDFSENVRQIMERMEFWIQIQKMHEKNLLYEVVKKFASDEVDLSPGRIDNVQMGYIFEELIRIGAEQANEEAGEHFTPREVIKLMVNLLLAPEEDLRKSHVVKTIYDPACGTGGMLSVAENYIRTLNSQAQPHLFGQDLNDEAYAICRADMLIKGEDSDNIKPECSFEKDGFPKEKFDYMLANPPFGVEWKQQQKTIEAEHKGLGYDGRFGAGLPRINDGSLLFLQHMISKMRSPEKGGSRIGIVFNGSPLFTGDAGSGESNIRQWIIENDWLEGIVALPDQLFYNTGISTYIWILTNRKEARRKGKIQLVDAREFFVKMRKSLGNKRNQIGDGEENRPDQIAQITKIYGNFLSEESVEREGKKVVVSRIFYNADFGYNKITVERPLRLRFQASAERIAFLDNMPAFQKIGKKKSQECQQRQEEIKTMLLALAQATQERSFSDKDSFLAELKAMQKKFSLSLSAPETKILLDALGEKDETAEIFCDEKGNSLPDPDLRDTENVPLQQKIEDYFQKEVRPHVPDAWIDHSKTKTGYEIPFNRHFYCYEPPRSLETIESEIKTLESEIMAMLGETTKRK